MIISNRVRVRAVIAGALLTLLTVATMAVTIAVLLGALAGPSMAVSVAAITGAWLTVGIITVGVWVVTQVRATIHDHDLAVATGLADLAEALDTQHVDNILGSNVRNFPRN